MKKFLAFVLAIICLTGCTNGASRRIALEKGDKRVIITSSQFIVDECESFTAAGIATWKLVYIADKDSTSIERVIELIK